jgi:hypothetical protein
MLSKIFFLIQRVLKKILHFRRKSQKSQIYGRVTILVGLIILSCSTMSIDTYHRPQNPIYKESPQAPGFMVYIKPFLNATETKKYFGVNLLKNNILTRRLNTRSSGICDLWMFEVLDHTLGHLLKFSQVR